MIINDDEFFIIETIKDFLLSLVQQEEFRHMLKSTFFINNVDNFIANVITEKFITSFVYQKECLSLILNKDMSCISAQRIMKNIFFWRI